MNLKSVTESFARMLSKNVVIYRQVEFVYSPHQNSHFRQPVIAQYPETEFIPKGDRGQNMFRMSVSGYFGWNPTAFVPGPGRPGLVVFVNDDIPDDWTHLLISGNSFPADKGGAGTVFANVPEPYDMDEYLNYRTQLANIYSDIVTDSRKSRWPWPEKMNAVRDIRPPENRYEEKHLFSVPFNDSGIWGYEFLTWGSVSSLLKPANA